MDQIPADKVIQAVPVVTALQVAAENAKKAGYTFRSPKFSPRNPVNKPDPVESRILKEMAAGGADEKILYEPDRIRYFKAVHLTQDCMYCHGDPKGAKDPTGGIKEGWQVGEIHGAFEIISSLDAANATVASAKISVAVLTVVCLGIVLIAVWFLVKTNLLKPLENAKTMIGHIADGDLTRQFQSDGRRRNR